MISNWIFWIFIENIRKNSLICEQNCSFNPEANCDISFKQIEKVNDHFLLRYPNLNLNFTANLFVQSFFFQTWKWLIIWLMKWFNRSLKMTLTLLTTWLWYICHKVYCFCNFFGNMSQRKGNFQNWLKSSAAKPPTFKVHWYGTAGASVPPYLWFWYIWVTFAAFGARRRVHSP